MTPDGTWRNAAIKVEPGKIDVYQLKDLLLVATFTVTATVDHKIHT